MDFKVEMWPIGDLIPYDKNPRKNDNVVDKMVEAIKQFGFRIPIVAKSTGDIVDGHLRYKAAKKLGLKEVPVALADDLSDEQIKAFRLLANRSATWAEWDYDQLKLELADLELKQFDLELTGFEIPEISAITFDNNNQSKDKDQDQNPDQDQSQNSDQSTENSKDKDENLNSNGKDDSKNENKNENTQKASKIYFCPSCGCEIVL